LLADGDSSSFRAGIVRNAGGATGLIRIRNFNPSQYPRECERAWDAATPAQRADAEGFAERVQDRWLASLAATIDRIKAERPDRLIVDVGTNSGGNESGDWSARLFTARPLRSAPVLMSAGPQALTYLDQEIALLRTALARRTDPRSQRAGRAALATLTVRRSSAESAPPCEMSWVWRERRAWRGPSCNRLVDVGFISGIVEYQAPGSVPDPRIARRIYWPAAADPLRARWTGPLYVLTNGATYSAAEMFAAALQNNRAARTVGTRSGGDGCGFMVEGVPVTLPLSRLRVQMPDCVRLRADGRNEVAGIAPDIPVPARAGESPRARAARLLDAVAADPSGSGS
jgi:hypothetical protein